MAVAIPQIQMFCHNIKFGDEQVYAQFTLLRKLSAIHFVGKMKFNLLQFIYWGGTTIILVLRKDFVNLNLRMVRRFGPGYLRTLLDLKSGVV